MPEGGGGGRQTTGEGLCAVSVPPPPPKHTNAPCATTALSGPRHTDVFLPTVFAVTNVT